MHVVDMCVHTHILTQTPVCTHVWFVYSHIYRNVTHIDMCARHTHMYTSAHSCIHVHPECTHAYTQAAPGER